MHSREFIVAGLLMLGSASYSRAQVPSEDTASYTGHDSRGIPRYANRAFTDEERALLRRAYGIEDPTRLYLSVVSTGECNCCVEDVCRCAPAERLPRSGV